LLPEGGVVITLDTALLRRLDALLAAHPRAILGITGPPGAGKSTLAAAIVDRVRAAGTPAIWVPMDSFHLAVVELERLGRRNRKGAIDTFDAAGYLALLRRIRQESTIVYAPEFDRRIEQPIAGAIPVSPEARLVVTEGNYLLDGDDPWPAVRDALTEVWFCDLPTETRRARLVARHVEFGKAPAEAEAWVETVDERNAERVLAERDLADCIVQDGALVTNEE